jgi:hypothetical protein
MLRNATAVVAVARVMVATVPAKKRPWSVPIY